MFSTLFDAWRSVLHISEWTGLSVGALAVIAAIVYFDPLARRFAIGVAALVIAIYCATIYGDHVGLRDKQAQWDAANAKAAAQAVQRDQQAPIVADANIEIAALRKQAKIDQEQINALRKVDATCRPISADELR